MKIKLCDYLFKVYYYEDGQDCIATHVCEENNRRKTLETLKQIYGEGVKILHVMPTSKTYEVKDEVLRNFLENNGEIINEEGCE